MNKLKSKLSTDTDHVKVTLEALYDLLHSLALVDDGFTKDGSYIFEIFNQVNVTDETKDIILPMVEQVIALLTEAKITGTHHDPSN